MPGWLLGLIISAALRLGLAWLVRRFPNLPPEVIDIIERLIDLKKNPEVPKDEKKEAERIAHRRIREVCTGVGCSNDLKGDE